jgi:hypothetical protein
MANSGHNGPLFKNTGMVNKKWIGPKDQIVSFDSLCDHDEIASKVLSEYYPGVTAKSANDELMERGWVRVYVDGYYEVWKLEGDAKSTVLDLIAALEEDADIMVDVIKDKKTIEMKAKDFLDKYL